MLNKTFINFKVEMLGLFSWALLTFSVVNVIYGFRSSFLICFIINHIIFGFLFLLFTYIYYQFEIDRKRILIHISIFSLLNVFFQLIYNKYLNLESENTYYYLYYFLISFIILFLISFVTKLLKYVL